MIIIKNYYRPSLLAVPSPAVERPRGGGGARQTSQRAGPAVIRRAGRGAAPQRPASARPFPAFRRRRPQPPPAPPPSRPPPAPPAANGEGRGGWGGGRGRGGVSDSAGRPMRGEGGRGGRDWRVDAPIGRKEREWVGLPATRLGGGGGARPLGARRGGR